MAQTQIYLGKGQIHVKETADDSYDNPDGDNSGMFLAQNITWTVDSSNWEPGYVREDYLQMDEVPGAASASLSFEIPIKGSGTIDSAPEYGEALKACGLEETSTASTSVTYTPISVFDGAGGNPGPAYSATALVNGVAYAIKGAFGNAVFNLAVGEPGIIAVTLQGGYVAVADDALESPTYETTVPVPFMGGTFASNFGGAYSDKAVSEMSLDLGNRLAMRQDVNETYGIAGARITGRKSTGSFAPEMVLVATHDYFGTWAAGTSGTLDTGVIGGTSGNRWRLQVGRCICRPPERTENDGIEKLTVPFAVSSAATDTEGTNFDVTLTLT